MPLLFILAFFCIFYMFYTFGPYRNEETIDSFPKEIVNELSDLNVLKSKTRESPLYIFNAKRFEEVRDNDVQAPNTCVLSGLKVIDKY